MLSPLADLERHAAESPSALALASPARSYSFAEAKELVDATASRLRELGVTPRAVVGVDLPAAQEWIVDLALLRLATRSVSLRGIPRTGSLGLDVLVVAPGGARVPAPLTIGVDDLWFATAVARASGPAPLVDYPREDSILRLMLTSGTTGVPRAAAYSVAALEQRRLGLDHYWSDGRAELNFMSLSTTGGFHTAIANLRHGQSNRAVDHINESTLRFAADQGIRVLCGSPQQVAGALAVMSEHSIELPGLEEVRLAGDRPTAALLRRIQSQLGVPVRSVYGSTEGGGVTMRMLRAEDDLADVGPAVPGVELQVVDGSVRYRGPAMTSGYLVDGVLQPFPGGWFSPGDAGTLSATGSLILSGREGDAINIGGLKIDPARVDALAAEFAGVADAAAFRVERPTGAVELGLAVVGDGDLRALDRWLRAELPFGYPTAFWRVAEIPRNRMGKVERRALTEAFARVV